MTNSLRTKITGKNVLGFKSITNLDIIELNRHYRIKQTLEKEKKSTYIRIKKYRNYLL